MAARVHASHPTPSGSGQLTHSLLHLALSPVGPPVRLPLEEPFFHLPDALDEAGASQDLGQVVFGCARNGCLRGARVTRFAAARRTSSRLRSSSLASRARRHAPWAEDKLLLVPRASHTRPRCNRRTGCPARRASFRRCAASAPAAVRGARRLQTALSRAALRASGERADDEPPSACASQASQESGRPPRPSGGRALLAPGSASARAAPLPPPSAGHAAAPSGAASRAASLRAAAASPACHANPFLLKRGADSPPLPTHARGGRAAAPAEAHAAVSRYRGDFEQLAVLGSGAFATVYEARLLARASHHPGLISHSYPPPPLRHSPRRCAPGWTAAATR